MLDKIPFLYLIIPTINDNLYKIDILTDALNYSELNFRQLTSIQDIDIVMISISMHAIKMLEITSLL